MDGAKTAKSGLECIVKNPLKTLHNTKKGIEKITNEGIEGFRLTKNNKDVFFQVVFNESLNIYHSFKKDPLRASVDAIEYCPVVGWIVEAGDDIYKVYHGHQALRPIMEKLHSYRRRSKALRWEISKRIYT